MWPYIIGEPTESGEGDMKMEGKEEEDQQLEKSDTGSLRSWEAEEKKKDVFGSEELDGELQRQRHPDGTVSWAGQRIG